MDSIARIPAPAGMMDYVQGLLWSSGELGRSVCKRGWAAPDVWAIAAPGTSAERALLSMSGDLVRSSANAWMDRWLIAQGKLAHSFCVVAQDPLALPMQTDTAAEPAKESPAWDVRGEESYLVAAKDHIAEGVMEEMAAWMISEEFIVYVIEDSWPFDHSRPLRDVAEKVRHILVPVSEGESYGVVSG